MNKIIKPADIMLQPDGSIYHIGLRPEELADTVICVGNPERVEIISQYFDEIELRRQHREFVSHTGWLEKKRLTVISTGIGTDNIDIVLNELDALVNIDLQERVVKPIHKTLNIIRLGTSGGLNADIPVDSFIISRYAIGMDILLNFYEFLPSDEEIDGLSTFLEAIPKARELCKPYFVRSCEQLYNHLKSGFLEGITISAAGFFAPQGRMLRAESTFPNLLEDLRSFSFHGERILNLEMEASAIYGLGEMLGHHCCTIAVLVANRATGEVSKNPTKSMHQLIETTLPKILTLPESLNQRAHDQVCLAV